MAGGGSRPGERRGGRKRGTPNKRTVALRAGLVVAGASPERAAQPPRLQPLELLVNTLNDTSLPLETRLDAARWAAPYCHAHQGRVDVSDISRPLQVTILRFADVEPLDRLAEKVIEHDPTEPPTSH
jgi:hypothetical protein